MPPSELKYVKCVVWDLDNTLWDGVLLEEKVTLRPESLEVLRELDRRGILHSIASKNDFELAAKQLQEFGLSDYFLCPQISWGPKSDAVKRIAETINIGIDSLAFVDDQPFEREEVRFKHPAVLCLDSADLRGLLTLPEMNPRFSTPDQANRRKMYQAEFARKAAEESFEGTGEDFLASLGMRMRISLAREADLQRVEELTVRTNQLNSTGYAYSYEELAAMLDSPRHLLLVTELTDKFGTYGKVGLALIERFADRWVLKLLIVSCRIASRGMGSMLLQDVMRRAKAAGARLKAEFRDTGRNRPMKVTFRFAGFRGHEASDGMTLYEHDLAAVPGVPSYVELTSEDEARLPVRETERVTA